jgi:outer membrane biosynthesis protein TonB
MNLLEDLMKKQIRFVWYISALVLFLSVGIALNAQQTAPPTQAPDAQAQKPATPDQAQPSPTPSQTPSPTPDQAQPSQTPSQTPSPTPDQAGKSASGSQGESAQTAGAQSFTGTVAKSGGKYVFQDEASGNTYDIDHQDEVQKFEGKKVKVRGTLDASTKTIHVQ